MSSIQQDDNERLLPTLPRTSPPITSLPITSRPEIVVYKRRWYILAVYCCISILQSLIYNTWGPIQDTARAVYYWDDGVIDLIAAWGAIGFCVTMAPFAWLMDVKGLRIAVILAAGFQLLGSILRCIPTNNTTFNTSLVHCAQIIADFSGPIGMAAPPLLSSVWFPPHQRTSATAISSMAGYTGTALSFIIGPAFVDDVSSLNIPKHGDNYILNTTLRHHYQGQINKLLYTEAGIMLFLFFTVLIYFPALPPTPPSLSAATGRVEFKTGLKALLKDYNFLLLVVVYGASTGFYGGWMGVLDQCLSEFNLHVDQNLAGWLGFVSVISGAVSGILFSLLADHFSGHLKLFLVIFMALSFYTILLICYVFTKVIPFNEFIVYVMFSSIGFFLNGTIPFFFELAVEITYPVSEGITSSVITFSNNFLQSIFLVVPLAHLGSKWMIWTTVATCAASTILLLFVKDVYKRSSVDKSILRRTNQHVVNTECN